MHRQRSFVTECLELRQRRAALIVDAVAECFLEGDVFVKMLVGHGEGTILRMVDGMIDPTALIVMGHGLEVVGQWMRGVGLACRN